MTNYYEHHDKLLQTSWQIITNSEASRQTCLLRQAYTYLVALYVVSMEIFNFSNKYVNTYMQKIVLFTIRQNTVIEDL